MKFGCLQLSASKIYEATRWLRKSEGVVASKDSQDELPEQNFRLGIRSGIILCKVLNRIERVPKVSTFVYLT